MQVASSSTLKYDNPCFDVTPVQNLPKGNIDKMVQTILSLLEHSSDSDKFETDDEDLVMDSTYVDRVNLIVDNDDPKNFSASTAVMPIMMVDASTIEKQLANLTKLSRESCDACSKSRSCDCLVNEQ